MPEAPAGVLITRPEPGASETAGRIAALGYRPIVAPMLRIRPLSASLPLPGDVQAVLVTSGNAISGIPASHHSLPLFAVGGATATRARSAGFGHVHSADGDGAALAALVARTCDPGGAPLLLACAKGQGVALAADLRARGFSVVRRAVYAAVPADDLPDSVRIALLSGEVSAALFFSAETARHCVHLLRAARLDQAVRSVQALAIGPRAAVALHPLPWRRVRIAAHPNQDAMLALLHE